MAQAKSTSQKPRSVTKHQCGTCGEIFTGKKCPNCGEQINILPLNKDGVPLQDIAEVAGLPPPDMAIRLKRAPDFFDPEEDLHDAVTTEYRSIRDEMVLDQMKTKAAEQAAKRLRAEQEFERTKVGFEPATETDKAQQPLDVSPAIFLQALGGWDPEQREQFLEYLSSNPQAALAISMMMNPGKVSGQMPMMNPMMGMGMFQPPAQPQVEPVDTASMLTAVVSAVQTMKEMSGGDGDSKATERILDKLEKLEERNKELELKIVEAQHAQKESISSEDIRRIVGDVMTTTTEGKVGLLNGLQEIHKVRDELIDLGVAQSPSKEIDPTANLEERKFEHQKSMDEKREKYEHELRIKEEEAMAAKADAQGTFINNLFGAAQAAEESKDEDKPEDDETATTPTGATCLIS